MDSPTGGQPEGSDAEEATAVVVSPGGQKQPPQANLSQNEAPSAPAPGGAAFHGGSPHQHGQSQNDGPPPSGNPGSELVGQSPATTLNLAPSAKATGQDDKMASKMCEPIQKKQHQQQQQQAEDFQGFESFTSSMDFSSESFDTYDNAFNMAKLVAPPDDKPGAMFSNPEARLNGPISPSKNTAQVVGQSDEMKRSQEDFAKGLQAFQASMEELDKDPRSKSEDWYAQFNDDYSYTWRRLDQAKKDEDPAPDS